MFEHLMSLNDADPAFTSVDALTPAQMLDAQIKTALSSDDDDWLTSPDKDVERLVQQEAARNAFKALNFDPNADKQKIALATLKTPAAVQHLTQMLTAYDWEFIDEAKKLRGYTVAKILDETNHSDARIRLKALQMLGNVTEVGLFTSRVEVTRVDATPTEVEERLRERLRKFLTGSATDVQEKPAPAPQEPHIVDDEVAEIAVIPAEKAAPAPGADE